MPKSFSEDGASGAFGGGTDTDTSTPNAPTMNDPGPNSPAISNTGVPSGNTSTSLGRDPYQAPTSFGSSAPPTIGGTPYYGTGMPVGFSFADGGAVPDADGDNDGDTSDGVGDSDGSPGQDLMAKALQSVDATLQYSYQKYGLGGGQQEAAAMPARPGTQSDYPGGGTYGPGGSPPPPQQQAGAMPVRPGSQSEYPGGGTYGPGGAPPPSQQMAANMPARPGTQSEYPGGGTYGPGGQPPQPQGAIDTEDAA